MKILLIEEDCQTSEGFKQRAEIRLHASVRIIESEHEFLEYLKGVASGTEKLPDLVISEMMFLWAFHQEPMPTGKEGDRRDAGARCLLKFRQVNRFASSIPWIFLSVLDRDEVLKRLGYEFDSYMGYANKLDRNSKALHGEIERFQTKAV